MRTEGAAASGHVAGAAGRPKFSAESQFESEAVLLGKYRHPNIVALIATCHARVADGMRLPCLVYEFMSGASLKDRLQAQSSLPPLTCADRFVIASDVARGLVFLHVAADPPIIHQDIKPDNILLAPAAAGAGVVAKLADFGTARITPKLLQASHVSTRNVAGTPVYMPPEYIQSGRVSAKTDTYAFGVVLLQMLTGKPPFHPQTRETLVNELAPALADPERLFAPHLDGRAGAWDTGAGCALAAIANRCADMRVDHRCAVAEVARAIDELAGRGGAQQQGQPQQGRRRWPFSRRARG